MEKDANGNMIVKKYVEDDKASKMTAGKKARLAKMRGGTSTASSKKTKQRSPVHRERTPRKKWAIENQTKGSVVQLAVDECTIKQTVYIYNCEAQPFRSTAK